ncbi:trigger factor [Roseburia sp. CAG:303]|nr:trigger factor [Roseburia sp. CAG:303]
MRKRFLAVVMCVCLGMTMFACGASKDDNTKETESGTSEATEPAYTEEDLVDDSNGDLNILDYVDLGDYKGIELTKSITKVTDDDVTNEMESKAVELTGSDVTVEDGDTAIIDFVGKLNGVAFDGGTASNYELEIGSGSFIDGFEDGLIGVKKGDTVDLNLTFPESYQSTELAGKDVVFTVTVNGVKRKPQLNDEWLAANTNYATLAEFAAETKQKLEDAAETTASNTLESSGLDQVISNSTVKKYYKSLIEQGESQYEKRLNAYASAYGKSLSELLAAQGMTESQYQNQKQKQAVSYAQVAMVVYAIAQDAGLSEADAEYQTILNDLANNYNMDAATFSSTYGESLVKSSVMSQYAMNYIVSNANVTTQEVEETEETTTAAE